MSADDMLAAQLWPWPDPVIKRNVQGGIIFVNAAFLQLYGGQVTDWHGCAVEGWPAPAPGLEPNRFETRLPSATGELVFDWLEYVMGDGGALAISRNITALLNVAPPPEPAYNPAPYGQAAAQPAQDSGYAAPPETYAPEASATPQVDAVQDTTMQPHNDAAGFQEPVAQAPHVEAFAAEAPLEHVVPAYEAEVKPAGEEPRERDYERRPLPIEDDESLLGTNWRDAVIAKAVGADAMAASADAVEQPMEEVAAIAAPEVSALTAKPEAEGNMIRILLAEDNAINALLTRTLLEADGCFVEVVEDGSLAVEAVKANQYDMILMDMRMPNMDGLESTRKIRTLSNEAKAIPIIALTANAFDDDRNACFDAGMNDFMTKPVSAEELQQMVRTWTSTANAVAA